MGVMSGLAMTRRRGVDEIPSESPTAEFGGYFVCHGSLSRISISSVTDLVSIFGSVPTAGVFFPKTADRASASFATIGGGAEKDSST